MASANDVVLARADKKNPPLCPTDDDDTIALRKKTRSFDYLWRSGVAGGLAGCAVCILSLLLARLPLSDSSCRPKPSLHLSIE